MKPILSKDIQSFLERFNNFRDGEFRSIELISPTKMLVTIAAQDNARDFDWLSIVYEFSDVNDAKLLENNKLPLIDMSDGINIITEDNKFIFCVGEYQSSSSAKNSICYIECSTVKYKESAF